MNKTVYRMILITVGLVLIIVTLMFKQNREIEAIDDLVSLNVKRVESIEIRFTSSGESTIIDEESMIKLIVEYLEALSIETFITDEEEVYGGFAIDIYYENEASERLKISGTDHEGLLVYEKSVYEIGQPKVTANDFFWQFLE